MADQRRHQASRRQQRHRRVVARAMAVKTLETGTRLCSSCAFSISRDGSETKPAKKSQININGVKNKHKKKSTSINKQLLNLKLLQTLKRWL